MNKLAILIPLMLVCMCSLASKGQSNSSAAARAVPTAVADKSHGESQSLPATASGPKVSYGSLYDGHTLIINIGDYNFLMQRVDSGTFNMGATAEQCSTNPVEYPAHQVNVSTFYIGETEVTQDIWIAVMGTNPSFFNSNMKHPVNNITWDDSQQFVKRLNTLFASSCDYKGISFSLPTEAEWEFAARGGIMSKGYRFAGSNSEGDVAWNNFNSEGTVHPVKGKMPNELGIYDMNGNVWEWCIDLWNPNFYSESPKSNPVCLNTQSQFSNYHVARGNGANSDSGGYIAWRNAYPITSKSGNIGMRLVLHLDASLQPD